MNHKIIAMAWIGTWSCFFMALLYFGVSTNSELLKEIISVASLAQFLCVFLCVGYRVFRSLIKLNDDEEYIKSKYPDIYKKLHPWGDFSISSVAYWSFSFSEYDDGEDSQLNHIKSKIKYFNVFVIWAFAILLIGQVLTSGPVWKSLIK
jgi:hypothetical protein